MRLIETIARWVRRDADAPPTTGSLVESAADLLERRGGSRYDLRAELEHFSVELDGVHHQLWNVSVAGFAAAGDFSSAPERARARIFKQGVCTREGLAILAWTDGQVAGYHFLPDEEGEAAQS